MTNLLLTCSCACCVADISRQFTAYTEAMETAVRDLAESENDLQTELQNMVQHSKQVSDPDPVGS